MNYRVFSLLASIIILSHLLLNRIDEIQLQNYSLIKKQVQPNSSNSKKIKEDITKYIENFESDLDIDDELDYDLDVQYKYRDDDMKINVPKLTTATPNHSGDNIEYALYKFDEQSKQNVFYSDPSAAQGMRTIQPDMYKPRGNTKVINGGYIDRKSGLKAYDCADMGFAAI